MASKTNNMIWYPWLTKNYKVIIQQHQKKKAHHAIFINTQKNIGAFELIWHISTWLLCLYPKGMKYCSICHGCQLMFSKNHPDWHTLNLKKNELFNIDWIHSINYKIHQSSQQGGSKIIFISDIKKLTESAVNALLKTLEEPPKKTWFFFINYHFSYSYTTLSSRCIIYNLAPPAEKHSLLWLHKEIKQKNISYLTALRINNGSPISAKKIIIGEMWKERIFFFQKLFYAFKNKNFISMLQFFKNKHVITKINWICLLFFDAIKLNLNCTYSLSNLDQIPLIKKISNNYSNVTLDNVILKWIQCKYRLITIPGINSELLLTEQLLILETI